MDIVSELTRYWQAFCDWFSKRKTSFIAVFVIGMLTHFELYSNNLVTPDGIWGDLVMYAREWDAQIGRFAWILSTRMRGGVVSSYFSAILVCAALAFVSLLLSDMWKIKHKFPQVLVGAVLVCSSLVACALSFPNFGEIYGWHILFAVLAVYLLVFELIEGQEILQTILAICCLALSLGFYQSSLSVFCVLSLCTAIEMLLSPSYEKERFVRFIIRFFTVFILGMLLYYAIAEFYQLLWGTTWASYKGASSISVGSVLTAFPSRFLSCYQDFITFLTRWSTLATNNFHLSFSNLGLVVLTLFSLVRSGFKLDTRVNKLLLVLFVALIPLAASAISIIVGGGAHVLTTGGLLCCICYAIARIEKLEELPIARTLGLVFALLLCRGYVLQDLTDYSFLRTVQAQTVALAERIWADVEHVPDYDPDTTPVVIIGTPAEGNYPLPKTDIAERTSAFARWGLFWNTMDASREIWPRIFLFYLGEGHQVNTLENTAYLSFATENPQVLAMPNYPAQGSVEMIDGMVVVKVSDSTVWIEDK